MLGIDETLHEQLTKLLMDNGAAVTKQSIDELIKYIGYRDQNILNSVVSSIERDRNRLSAETRP